MRYTYQTKDTCAQEISFDLNDDVVTNVTFMGGCNGNLKAISLLVNGLTVDAITEKFEGLTCGRRPTSCSDQFSIALKQARAEMKSAI